MLPAEISDQVLRRLDPLVQFSILRDLPPPGLNGQELETNRLLLDRFRGLLKEIPESPWIVLWRRITSSAPTIHRLATRLLFSWSPSFPPEGVHLLLEEPLLESKVFLGNQFYGTMNNDNSEKQIMKLLYEDSFSRPRRAIIREGEITDSMVTLGKAKAVHLLWWEGSGEGLAPVTMKGASLGPLKLYTGYNVQYDLCLQRSDLPLLELPPQTPVMRVIRLA